MPPPSRSPTSSGFSEPVEDWPVANPFIGGPTILALSPSTTTLVVPDVYARHTPPYRASEPDELSLL